MIVLTTDSISRVVQNLLYSMNSSYCQPIDTKYSFFEKKINLFNFFINLFNNFLIYFFKWPSNWSASLYIATHTHTHTIKAFYFKYICNSNSVLNVLRSQFVIKDFFLILHNIISSKLELLTEHCSVSCGKVRTFHIGNAQKKTQLGNKKFFF